MKKIKLLTPVVSAIALSTTIVPLASCSSQGTTITAKLDVQHGGAVVSEIQLNKEFKVLYSPESDKYEMDKVIILMGGNTLTRDKDYVVNGNIVTVNAKSVTSDQISITITAKEVETIVPTLTTPHASATYSEIKLNKRFTVTYIPDQGYEMDEVSITIGNKELVKDTDYTVAGNIITVNANAVNDKNISINITSKETEPTITPTVTAEHGKAVVSEVKLHKSFSVAYAPDLGYILDTVTIVVGTTTLTEGTDYVVSNNLIVVNASAVNDQTIRIAITAKEDTGGLSELYIKENTYLCENLYIETEYNATSHEVSFALKAPLEAGQHLEATITDLADEEDKILKEETVDLTDFTFDQYFYVPVKYITYILRQTLLTKFTIEIKCMNGTTQVWSNKYDTLYINFNALNAWAGEDYRGYTNQYTHMDNMHFSVHLPTSLAVSEAQFPFPIQLRETVAAGETLHAAVYNSEVHQRHGTIIPNVCIDLQKFDITGAQQMSNNSWFRSTWDATNKWYNYSWQDNTAKSNIVQDTATQVGQDKKTCYDLMLTAQYTQDVETETGYTRHAGEPVNPAGDFPGGRERSAFDHAYATFDIVVWKTDSNNDIVFYENFSGCKMTFIPSGFNA